MVNTLTRAPVCGSRPRPVMCGGLQALVLACGGLRSFAGDAARAADDARLLVIAGGPCVPSHCTLIAHARTQHCKAQKRHIYPDQRSGGPPRVGMEALHTQGSSGFLTEAQRAALDAALAQKQEAGAGPPDLRPVRPVPMPTLA